MALIGKVWAACEIDSKAARIEGRVFSMKSWVGGKMRSAVQVSFDYSRGISKRIDGPDRDILEAWRAAAQNSSAMPADTAPMRPPST